MKTNYNILPDCA